MTTIELRVFSLTSPLCEVKAERHWTVAEVQRAVQGAVGTVPSDQVVLLDSVQLKPHERLGTRISGEVADLTVVSNKFTPTSRIASGRFGVGSQLGAGCFAVISRGKDTETGQDVAIKREDIMSALAQLEAEAGILKRLSQPELPQGFPAIFYCGVEGSYRCLVMELLGETLEERLQQCKGKFEVSTVGLLADQLLHRIEYLHSKGFVHRDIKPENFVCGVKHKMHHIYLIDFGLSKEYWHGRRHATMTTRLSLTGTPRYASLNAHRGLEQSRRDDLEAIGHMMIYFLRGSLPWSGLEARTKQEKYRRIFEKKLQEELSNLCRGFPEAFVTYMKYSRGLEYEKRPDYDMLRGLFKDSRGEKKEYELQWFNKGFMPSNLEPLKSPCRVYQPDDQDNPAYGRSGTINGRRASLFRCFAWCCN
mmetsp:Transcript_49332/g.89196  ORF Transcript_49332/g.89196 Transcript_49332/m.89196 type:complete len:420 (-) Transcript_49332:46-1305(-)